MVETKIQHPETNASEHEQAKTLQSWVFPSKQNVKPRYDQKSFDIESQMNTFVTVVMSVDIEGRIEINNKLLNPRDAMGITDFESFRISTQSKSKILLVEVPMQHN